jgi:predicted ATPase
MLGYSHDVTKASMLLAFRAENARSFRDRFELSLEGTRLSNPDAVREISWREDGHPVPVLPVAAVFGANASGKSSLLRVMYDMRRLVISSFRVGWPEGRVPPWPFRLGTEGENLVSKYEIDLVLDDVRHEYGFHLGAQGVLHEWAHHYPRGRKALLFDRRGPEVRLGRGHASKGRAAREILREDSLFLSAAGAASHPRFLPLYEWFQRNLLFAAENSRFERQALTADLLDADKEGVGLHALELLQEADLGITGAKLREVSPELRQRLEEAVDEFEEGDNSNEGVSVQFQDLEIRMKHKAGRQDIELLPEEESRGTLVWFGLIGPVLFVLRQGSVLLADELDASLHPALVAALVRLFQSKKSNPRRAQLIFNSHDVSLMGHSEHQSLGRDQIWFTEKDDDGGTHLYPLTDLDPRKEEAIARRYLAGRYGATPIVSFGRLEGIAEASVGGDKD